MEVEIPILSPAFGRAYLNTGPYESYRLEGRIDNHTFQQQTAAISSFISANCPRKSVVIICQIVFGLATLILIILTFIVFWTFAHRDVYSLPPTIIFFMPLIVIAVYGIISAVLNAWFTAKLGQLDRSLQTYLHSVNVAIAQTTSLRFQLRIKTSLIRSCIGFTDPYVMNTFRGRYVRGLCQYWVIILSGPNQLNVFITMPGSGYYYPQPPVNPANQDYHYSSPVAFSYPPTGSGNLPPPSYVYSNTK